MVEKFIRTRVTSALLPKAVFDSKAEYGRPFKTSCYGILNFGTQKFLNNVQCDDHNYHATLLNAFSSQAFKSTPELELLRVNQRVVVLIPFSSKTSIFYPRNLRQIGC